MNFFILAAGEGVRAKPLTEFKPKPAFPLNSVPLISLLLNQLQNQNIKKGFINLMHKKEVLEGILKDQRGIHLLYEETLSGSRIIKKAAKDMDDLLLVVNGDVFIKIPAKQLKEKLLENKYDAVLLVRKVKNRGYRSLICENSEFIKRGISSEEESIMYTGVCLLTKKVVNSIEHENFFDSVEKNNFRTGTLIYEDIWLDLGSPRHYLNSHAEYMKYAGFEGKSGIERSAVISEDSEIINSVIWDNVKISGSVIKNSVILNNCDIRGENIDDSVVLRDRVISPVPYII